MPFYRQFAEIIAAAKPVELGGLIEPAFQVAPPSVVMVYSFTFALLPDPSYATAHATILLTADMY